VQSLFLPQIRWAGCNDFITTFARHEFGFAMKSNAHCRLAGWRVCFQQPMNGGNGRRWRSVTTGRRLIVSLFIFTSPVLPQICHWPVRKSHSFLAAIFFGTLMANFGTHDGQGRNKVHFDKFPQGGKSPHLGKYFLWGHRADRKPAVKLSPRKPQLRGAFALQAKNLAYDRRRFDRTAA
jgi:hypothetical protein